MNGIEEILIKIGFDLKNENSNYWRAIPVYRESSNASSLRISKESGSFIDFAANVKGSFYELVQLSLGLSDLKQAKAWIESEGYEREIIEKKPKIIVDKKIELKYVNGLMPHFSFYENEPRNIKKEILTQFECGVCFSGKQSNRFVFVIRDENGTVTGVIGRDLLGSRIKWKKMGDSRKWVFPLLSLPEIEETGEVFLVESIGDMLALYQVGVRNVVVIFGLDISNRLVSLLSTLRLKKIYISTNNDSQKKENWGMMGAEGIKKKLSKVIDEEIISIALPPKGDWGEMSEEERKEYAEKIRNNR